MQLNFLGLVLVGIGIIALALGISGNYKTFTQTVTQSLRAKPGSMPGGTSGSMSGRSGSSGGSLKR